MRYRLINIRSQTYAHSSKGNKKRMLLNSHLSLKCDSALEIHGVLELLEEDESFDGANEMATIRATRVE